MAIECYHDHCPFHASHKTTDPENCEGPYCFEDECRVPGFTKLIANEIWVHVGELLPFPGTCCWVKLQDLEGSYPGFWDGEKWVFQIRGLGDHPVTHWRTNPTGCVWYRP